MAELKEISTADRIYYELIRIRKEIDSYIELLNLERAKSNQPDRVPEYIPLKIRKAYLFKSQNKQKGV